MAAPALNPFVLGGAGVWRLWTCHLVHFGVGHALLNLAALGVPFALVPARAWPRMLLGLFLVAPLLSLILLPGLACAAWSMAGAALVRERGTRVEGILLLGLLGAKLAVEAWSGAALLPGGAGWVSLPAAHRWGALLGWLSSRLLRNTAAKG